MTHARAAALASAALAITLGIVLLGRWSADRGDDAQLAGIARILHAVGPLDGRALDAYRVTPSFDCLLYGTGHKIGVRELCFDATGGLIEAIDRTRVTPRFWSVRYEPGLATIRVPPARLLDVLRQLGAGAFVAGAHDLLPVGHRDVGPLLRGQAPPQ
jgi:hypothetical protein